eukprot:scaffold94109_cov30-Attheya_sp.AAC.2
MCKRPKLSQQPSLEMSRRDDAMMGEALALVPINNLLGAVSVEGLTRLGAGGDGWPWGDRSLH